MHQVPFFLVPAALLVGLLFGLAGFSTYRRAAYRDFVVAHQRQRWESIGEVLASDKGASL